MRACLSIRGLWNWDRRILDGLQVPEGINREDVINTILSEAAELEVIYPDWEVMYHEIETWSRTMQYTWTRWLMSVEAEYNPIHNYDRTEHHKENEHRSLKLVDQYEPNLQETERITPGIQETQQSGTTLSRNAYDTLQLTPAENTTTDTTVSRNGKDEVYRGYGGHSRNRRDDDGDIDHTREIHSEGNIGVTSTQKMLSEEREVAKFNLVREIAKSFMNRFCIMVW